MLRSVTRKLNAFQSYRSLFLSVESTPNPKALKFLPGSKIYDEEVPFLDLDSQTAAVSASPLANNLFNIPHVNRVFITKDFISVTVEEEQHWDNARTFVSSAISQYIESGKPVLRENFYKGTGDDNVDEDEVVSMIKELIDTRIRPTVQEDGGDIVFIEFTGEGIVRLKLAGACAGCPSSSVTLKHGIANMLMHYIPEVEGVEEVV